MLFNSYAFIFCYLPIVLIGFFLIGRTSHQLAALWLAIASLFFYGWWNPKYVLLILISIGFNYVNGCSIRRLRQPNIGKSFAKPLLIFAIAANLLLLGYFKYANFFISTVNNFANAGWSSVNILLPLGISFFTFTQIAYLVDTYRGVVKADNFVHYLLFVTYFPHLIAGPVLHHKQVMPQFCKASIYRPSANLFALGITLFILGLAKKVLLADSFSVYVSPIFADAAGGTQPQFFPAWEAALGYALQIYFDFSGYSDMAVGLSMMFGVALPINFNSPYKAWNLIEFWRRWHITLSHFLRDYLYLPLGGNRLGHVRRYLNIAITMLLGGLWHGANWTFVVWGALHGILLVTNHAWQMLRNKVYADRAVAPSRWGRVFGVFVTFVCVVVTWVFFRAKTVDSALLVLKGMSSFSSQNVLPSSQTLGVFLFGLGVVFFAPNTQTIINHIERHVFDRVGIAYALVTGLIGTFCLLSFGERSEFLYFQF